MSEAPPQGQGQGPALKGGDVTPPPPLPLWRNNEACPDQAIAQWLVDTVPGGRGWVGGIVYGGQRWW